MLSKDKNETKNVNFEILEISEKNYGKTREISFSDCAVTCEIRYTTTV